MNAAKNCCRCWSTSWPPWRTPVVAFDRDQLGRRGIDRGRVRYSVDSSVRITGGGCRLAACAPIVMVGAIGAVSAGKPF